MDFINGFSQKTPAEKVEEIIKHTPLTPGSLRILKEAMHPNPKVWKAFSQFTENVISGYHLPFSIAPNFVINGKLYHLPMVIEESSVVAAASWSAKFWSQNGGFTSTVVNDLKVGQIHFTWSGSQNQLDGIKTELESYMTAQIGNLTKNMEQRGGGIVGFDWLNLNSEMSNLFQCRVTFRTADSMGANFINTCLEEMAKQLTGYLTTQYSSIPAPEVIMAILSNYTPECLVHCTIECPIDRFSQIKGVDDPLRFAERFVSATEIARFDPYRAVTHNKGIFNGMDAVVLATANDFRAFEAGGHAFASRNGRYSSLTSAKLVRNWFSYTLEIPMAVGVVGGLTNSHPMAALSLELLGQPTAGELMQIIAAAGLANNFSAIKALTTSGIQKGHMRMHLSKILLKLGASAEESKYITAQLAGQTISYQAVEILLNQFRNHS